MPKKDPTIATMTPEVSEFLDAYDRLGATDPTAVTELFHPSFLVLDELHSLVAVERVAEEPSPSSLAGDGLGKRRRTLRVARWWAAMLRELAECPASPQLPARGTETNLR